MPKLKFRGEVSTEKVAYGDHFWVDRKDGEEYILAQAGCLELCLISLENANRVSDAVKVRYNRNISKQEWAEIASIFVDRLVDKNGQRPFDSGRPLSVGMHFHCGNEKYILAHVGDSNVCLISLRNGNRWAEPVSVVNLTDMTRSNWEEITRGETFNLKED